MIDCWGCDAFARNPRSGYYAAGCEDCVARQLAHSPDFHASAGSSFFTPSYRAALQLFFGDRWAEGHEKVKAASEEVLWRSS